MGCVIVAALVFCDIERCVWRFEVNSFIKNRVGKIASAGFVFSINHISNILVFLLLCIVVPGPVLGGFLKLKRGFVYGT